MDSQYSSVYTGPGRLLLILNPVSGRKIGRKYFPEIIRIFTSAGYMVTTFVTGDRGEAHQYVEHYGGMFDRVVCIGGDGTLNEVVSGITAAGHRVTVGYIPAGSTNDFAACHGLAPNTVAAARDIVSGSAMQLDIGKFNSHYFTYVAAFGAFSWLSYTTPQNLKNIFGHTAYILDGIKDLSMVRPVHMRLTADGEVHEQSYIFGAVSNSTSIAGTIGLPPSLVDLNDGLFEVLLIRSPTTAAELQAIIASMLNQDFKSCPLIELFKAAQITVESNSGVEWTLDGEYEGSAPKIEISNIHNSLSIIVNK